MEPEEQDPVWELLREARRHEPGPFFARNVAREARRLGTASPSFSSKLLAWLQAYPLALPGTAVAAITLTLMLAPGPPSTPELASEQSTAPPEAPEVLPTLETEIPEFAEELGELDEINELLALQDVSALDDAAIERLLF